MNRHSEGKYLLSLSLLYCLFSKTYHVSIHTLFEQYFHHLLQFLQEGHYYSHHLDLIYVVFHHAVHNE